MAKELIFQTNYNLGLFEAAEKQRVMVRHLVAVALRLDAAEC